MAHRERLISDLVRLRRARRRAPKDADLAAVQADLEAVAGPTVGRAAAARLLGVSQTALDRWVASGEVPVVTTPGGRREVPLPALVELIDAVEQRRRTSPDRHPLGAVLRERDSHAARLDTRQLLPDRERAAGHRAAELRGLVYHRAVARQLDDEVVADALARVRRWRSEGRIHPRYADEWEALLTGSRSKLARAIGEDGEHAAALRQSSPLAGTLDEPTRQRVLDLVATGTAA